MESLEFTTHLYPFADIIIGKEKSNKLHVMSCYIMPPQEQTDQFYDDLQQALTAIPSDEMYVLLGDFNARVGSRLGNDDLCMGYCTGLSWIWRVLRCWKRAVSLPVLQ